MARIARRARKAFARAAEAKREAKRDAAHGPLLVATNQRIGAVEASMLELARCTRKLAEATSTELQTENAKLSAQVSRLKAEKLQTERHGLKAAQEKATVIDLPAMRVAQ
jgi:hypothetical protein